MRVYSYTIDGSRHCKEGWAIETEDGTLRDTYWHSDRSVLSKEEVTSAVLEFDTDDFEELPLSRDERAPKRWMSYAPKDRGCIPSQHGLSRQWFIRRGASPDLSTEIENQENELSEARTALGMAQYRVDRAEEKLTDLYLRTA